MLCEHTTLDVDATQDALFDIDRATDSIEEGQEHQVMFVRLRPGAEAQFNTCLLTLGQMREKHIGADIEFAGYAFNGNEHVITLGINFGPKNLIAKFGPQAVSAYNLVQDIFTTMHQFLPQYCSEPTVTEAQAAANKALDAAVVVRTGATQDKTAHAAAV